MKQLDRLLLKSFIGPFLVAFAIALFTFLMQYLWVYIDEIIGKGAGLLLIAELVGYLSVSMMPMALPVAVLIASVMTMGNLAEHYELTSMKSAGVPLLRIMTPLMLLALLIAGFSFSCSNYLIPVANLKARTRLYDIRKQKPSLSLEEGAFNDDFQGFAIRIGKKGADEKTLEDVMLFRQGGILRGRIEAVSAETGSMEVTPDERFFVLQLQDGFQYQEPEMGVEKTRRTYPFVRTKFATYRKTFDLSEFEIERTDESAFQGHQTMLSVAQLTKSIDSIGRAMEERRERLGIEVGRFIAPLKQLDRRKLDSLEQIKQDSIKLAADLALAADDNAELTIGSTDTAKTTPSTAEALTSARRISQSRERIAKQKLEAQKSMLLKSVPDSMREVRGNFREYILSRPNYKRTGYLDRAIQFSRTIQSYAEGATRRLGTQRSALVNHIYEKHSKMSFAMACFIFLFIGAPMGAIIRKGGFGYPILVSIIFFMIFIVLTIMCKKLMASYTLLPAAAAWLPTLVIFPIGAGLTYMAMIDRSFDFAGRIGKLLTAIAKPFKARFSKSSTEA